MGFNSGFKGLTLQFVSRLDATLCRQNLNLCYKYNLTPHPWVHNKRSPSLELVLDSRQFFFDIFILFTDFGLSLGLPSHLYNVHKSFFPRGTPAIYCRDQEIVEV